MPRSSSKPSTGPKLAEARSTCPLGVVLDLVGDRWSLLIIRDLFFKGFHEFREFLESGEGIASNILSDRLKRLRSAGLIESRAHPEDGKKKQYFLTSKGKSLLPLMIEMTLWGLDHLPDTMAPPQIVNAMRSDRETFSRSVLEQLENWESGAQVPGSRADHSITEE